MTSQEALKKQFERWQQEAEDTLRRADAVIKATERLIQETGAYLDALTNEYECDLFLKTPQSSRYMEVVEPDYVQCTGELPFTRPKELCISPN